MGTRSQVEKLSEGSIFTRNLAYMVERLDPQHAPRTLAMLEEEFPAVRDFQQLRSLAKAFVANDCQPLRKVPVNSDVDLSTLQGEARLRFHEGFFRLGKGEDMVFRGEAAYGPYAREQVSFMARKVGAQSPTNDDLGHIVDPEEVVAHPITTTVEL